jgi:hypothetical protein
LVTIIAHRSLTTALATIFRSSQQVIKGATYDPTEVTSISILLFYQYAKPQWSEARKLEAVRFVESTGARLNLGGRVRVACEGVDKKKEADAQFQSKHPMGSMSPITSHI